MGDDPAKPISLFYSYSHRDEDLRDRLHDHLAVLRWSGVIADWHDREIPAGTEWEDAIDSQLASADIVLLLVSASFIASPYCWGKEVTKALARHDRGEARVIPVILKPCRWQSTPFARLQAVPRDGTPVTEWHNPDAALDDVVAAIERVVGELRRQRAGDVAAKTEVPPPPAPPKASGPADFEVFRDVDAPWCPEMVALPAGTFLMGSPEDEKERSDDEGPRHRVTIGTRFAIGRYPVTVGEYGRFVQITDRAHDGGVAVPDAESKYGEKIDKTKSWRDPGFAQTDRHPVVGVSWGDAQAYAKWLAAETGKAYRLPSEAEWEYACRARTATRFSFGDDITDKDANFALNVGQTSAVGSYPANPWGLFDMHGNVHEWVEDNWREGYDGAPTDGSAVLIDPAEEHGVPAMLHVKRGACWCFRPQALRSAGRSRDFRIGKDAWTGFRVARTLDEGVAGGGA